MHQQCRMQQYSFLLSRTYGLPQHCTRKGLSLDITMWTTELTLLTHSHSRVDRDSFTSHSPALQGHTLSPASCNVSICVLFLWRKYFPLKMNSLHNKWKLLLLDCILRQVYPMCFDITLIIWDHFHTIECWCLLLLNMQ